MECPKCGSIFRLKDKSVNIGSCPNPECNYKGSLKSFESLNVRVSKLYEKTLDTWLNKSKPTNFSNDAMHYGINGWLCGYCDHVNFRDTKICTKCKKPRK